MSPRFPATCCTLAAVLALASLAAAPAAAQTELQAPADWTTPRTAWGDPDLQAIWNNATITPLERPAQLADKAFLTADEVAAAEQQALDRVNQQNAPSEVRTEPLPAGGNVGAYNSYWTEQSTSIVKTMRTSLITDPADGRLPPLTPQALARITSPSSVRLADVQEGRVPADGPEEMGLSERCLWYRGIPTFPTGYNNNYHFFQTPDFVLILQEHIHDLRVVYLDDRPHLPANIRQFAGSFARLLGGRHPGHRDHQPARAVHSALEPPRALALPRPAQRVGARNRALHARRPRLARLPVHGRRSRHLDAALVRRPALHAQPPADVRVRLPRGELRAAQHHGRVAGRGSRGGPVGGPAAASSFRNPPHRPRLDSDRLRRARPVASSLPWLGQRVPGLGMQAATLTTIHSIG